MKAIILKSNAKINLLLNIADRREDGYHNLDGVMIPVSIFDIIRVAKSDNIALRFDDTSIPYGEDNTAYKAAAAFFEYTGINAGADIFIHKRIPVKSGLGGGSSNAACVLNALNELYYAKLSKEELIDISKNIGADAAFFISDCAKRARGKGESLDEIDYNFDVSYLIVKPFGGVNTDLAYRFFHKTSPKPANTDICINALMENDIGTFKKNSKNMLQQAGIMLCPAIKKAIRALYRAGALFSQMTGSGSAVYGMFKNKLAAQKAFDKIRASNKFEYIACAEYTDKTYEPLISVK